MRGPGGVWTLRYFEGGKTLGTKKVHYLLRYRLDYLLTLPLVPGEGPHSPTEALNEVKMTQVEPLRAGLLCSVTSAGHIPGPVLLRAGLSWALHDQGCTWVPGLALGSLEAKDKGNKDIWLACSSPDPGGKRTERDRNGVAHT